MRAKLRYIFRLRLYVLFVAADISAMLGAQAS